MRSLDGLIKLRGVANQNSVTGGSSSENVRQTHLPASSTTSRSSAHPFSGRHQPSGTSDHVHFPRSRRSTTASLVQRDNAGDVLSFYIGRWAIRTAVAGLSALLYERYQEVLDDPWLFESHRHAGHVRPLR